MGSFNVVHADVACPRCGTVNHVGVQFKYGHTYQLEYSVGDELQWGGNDIGKPGHHRVVVLGIAEEDCQSCRFGSDDDWDVYVQLQDDRIIAVEPVTGCYDFVGAQETFFVLDA